MELLVHYKETEEVRGGGVGQSASPAFPKGRAEIVSFGQHSPFPDIKTLAEGIKVEEAICKLQIGIRDGTMWVVSRHQPRGDKIWPLVLPYKRLCGSETSAGGQGGDQETKSRQRPIPKHHGALLRLAREAQPPQSKWGGC